MISGIDEKRLNKTDRLGLAYCRLNFYEWDEILGEEPEGFSKLPKYDRYFIKRLEHPLVMKLLSKLFPDKYGKKLTKVDYILPPLKNIEKQIGEANISRCWWIYELGRTEEEWQHWYHESGHASTKMRGDKYVKAPHIVISTDGTTSDVNIDGSKIKGVTAIKFSHDAGNAPYIEIKLLATDVTFDMKCIPALPSPFDRFYVSKSKVENAGYATFEQLDEL